MSADGAGVPPRALLAVPGDLATPTGGYEYARRLLGAARGAGLMLDHWPLPGGFPEPTDAVVEETLRRLETAPTGWPIIVDGLALGALPAGLLGRIKTPLVALCHHPLALETGLDAARASRLRETERAALAAARHVITTSETTARTLIADFGVARERVTVARPGTDPAAEARGSGRGCQILSVGSLTPRKGHDLLIAALAGLADLDWRLAIVGPADRDPAHAAALARQISEAGLDGRVTLAGAADRAGLEAAYAGADLFALASRYEGYGMAYTEAMAHGLPVLGTETGAVREATRGAARLVPPGDVQALRDALGDLVESASARAALARGCREAAAGLPRWEDTARIVAGVLRPVLAGG